MARSASSGRVRTAAQRSPNPTTAPPESTTRQIALPESYVDALDFTDAEDAIDETVTLGITDADGEASTITATVVAVVQSTLANADTASTNDTLTAALYDRQSVGLSEADKTSYTSAIVELDSAATPEEVEELKTALSDEGYTAQTVDDQIGDFKTVIDTIVLILNGFAVIALLAAGFGIVNTLLMSVRERTREIGLWKAMGFGAGKIFTLFSLEAVFIGLAGSLIGIGAAVGVGTIANSILTGSVLAGLPGLSVVAFLPATLIGITGLVTAIAFLAGTISALSAARQDPIGPCATSEAPALNTADTAWRVDAQHPGVHPPPLAVGPTSGIGQHQQVQRPEQEVPHDAAGYGDIPSNRERRRGPPWLIARRPRRR